MVAVVVRGKYLVKSTKELIIKFTQWSEDKREGRNNFIDTFHEIITCNRSSALFFYIFSEMGGG